MMSRLVSFASSLLRPRSTSSKSGQEVRPLFDAESLRVYDEHDYMTAYAKHIDQRIINDPRVAIGGMWEEIGRLQFDFLKREGLQPKNDFLDLGCGSLRGGRFFIDLLERGRYTGIDISAKAIETAEQLVLDEGLLDKKPQLIVNDNPASAFGCIPSQRFDVVLAQSVLTHLPEENVRNLFAEINGVLNTGARFFFTFRRGTEVQRTGINAFRYPFSFFQDIAAEHGLSVEDRSADYAHPRNQSMAVVTSR